MSPLKGALLLVLALVLVGPPSASAIPISAHVAGCIDLRCTAVPDDGPVPLDPLGFTLDVFWGPEFIELLANPDDRGEWRLNLLFESTGVDDGTEHMGAVTLLDRHGSPIDLTVEFDDRHGNSANYEIFGPENEAFRVFGFRLAHSDFGGVDTLAWTGFTVFPATAGRLTEVPEPTSWLLLTAGLAATALARRRRRRSR